VSHRTLTSVLFVLLLLPAAHATAQEGVKLARPEDAPEPVLTKPPAVTRFVDAKYPPEALAAGTEADVGLIVDVDETGKVSSATVSKAAGSGFDEAALVAVRAFEFSPAEIDHKPGPVRIEYVYHFRIEKRVVRTAAPADAQGTAAVVVKGRVRERGTKLPVAGASLAFEEREAEVRADGSGAWSVADLPPGTHKVKVVAPDYRPVETTVELKPGGTTELDFFLKPLNENPYETVVHGEREKEVVARYTVSQRELSTVPGTFGDPVRVVQNLPGVARSPYVLGMLLVRGSYPNDSGIFLDGVRVPMIYHLMGGPSVVNPQMLSRIDFYPGNFGVRYGGATGGIVEVETSRDTAQAWHGAADLNLFFSGGYLEAPLSKKVSLKLAARRSYYDLVVPIFMRAMGATGTTVLPVFWDYQGRLDVSLPGEDHLSFLVLGSDDWLDVATTRNKNDFTVSTHTGFHRLLGRWEWHPTPSLTNVFAPFVGYESGRMSINDGDFDSEGLLAGVRDDLSWRVHPALELRAGVDVDLNRLTYSAYMPPIKDWHYPGEDVRGRGDSGLSIDNTGDKVKLDTTLQQVDVGTYVEAVWQPWKPLKLVPGLRFDVFLWPDHRRYSVDPRLTTRVEVGWGVTLKAGAGLFHQPPSGMMLDPNYGNPDLSLEWAEQYSFGAEKRVTDAISLDVQGFCIRRHALAGRSRGTDREGDTLSRERYSNDGWGRAYGLEVLLKHDVTRWFYGWLAYTLSRSEEALRSGDSLSPSRFDQTHILTAVASVRLGRGWEVGSRFRLVSGNPETPRLGGTFVADSQRFRPVLGERDSARHPLFHQLDLRVEKTWDFERWMLSLYLDVQNVYYARNEEFTTYDYRYRSSYGIQGIPILPTFGLKGSF
jgi:TonB family protein